MRVVSLCGVVALTAASSLCLGRAASLRADKVLGHSARKKMRCFQFSFQLPVGAGQHPAECVLCRAFCCGIPAGAAAVTPLPTQRAGAVPVGRRGRIRNRGFRRLSFVRCRRVRRGRFALSWACGFAARAGKVRYRSARKKLRCFQFSFPLPVGAGQHSAECVLCAAFCCGIPAGAAAVAPLPAQKAGTVPLGRRGRIRNRGFRHLSFLRRRRVHRARPAWPRSSAAAHCLLWGRLPDSGRRRVRRTRPAWPRSSAAAHCPLWGRLPDSGRRGPAAQ